MNKPKLIKLVNQIKYKSFPELEEKKIYVYNFTFGKYAGGANWILPFWRALFISKKKKFSKTELKSVIAHELSHFAIWQKMGYFKYSFWGMSYWISSQYRKKVEFETDKLAIQKGYARGVYSIAKKSKIKNRTKHYLSAEEIKNYAKEIGKW